MKQFGYIIESIANKTGQLSGWLVPVMMVLVLFEAFMRYVVRQPPIVADEFSAYMYVALSFLAMGYTWTQRGHVRVSALVIRLPPRVASWIRLFTLVSAFGFSIMLCFASYGLLSFSFKIHMLSDTHLRTPLQGPQMTLIIGFVILSLLLVVEVARAINRIRSGGSAEEETG